MESVPDLQHTMYASIEGYPCVRLLNLSGNIGCSSESRSRIFSHSRFSIINCDLGINCELNR